MKKVIIKSTNNSGNKCKTYIYECENAIIFHKITLLLRPTAFNKFVGGETIIKETIRYKITYHCFSIKKDTLFCALGSFALEG